MRCLLILIVFLLHLNVVAQNNDLPPFAEPGKCYVQAIAHDYFKPKDSVLLVYTGDNSSSAYVKSIEILIKPSTTKWKRDTNNEYYLVEFPAIYEEYQIVTDTNQIKNFRETIITREILALIGGRSSWAEVLCNKQTTPKLIRRLQRKLIQLNYLKKSNISGLLDNNTKDAFREYQIENGFPAATLDLRTLKHLEIRF